MASPTMAAGATVPHFQPWAKPQMQIRAKSPYGLPVVDDCLRCTLRDTNFFCGVSPATMKALDQIKHTSSYPEGAVIFMEGEAARGVYLLCQGRAKLLTANSEGKTLILKIAQPGEVLGLSAVVAGNPHEFTVETLQPSQLAFIGREEFQKFVKEHGDACLHITQHLSRDCRSAYEVIRSIGLSQSVSERLARFLLEWSADGRMSDGVFRVKLTLTHEEMAQLIGCSRETVSRILSEFKKRRMVELNGATLLVRNKAALESLAAA
jgi:CRP/FNR family cyclic AMP-dependent transcriptional regulator